MKIGAIIGLTLALGACSKGGGSEAAGISPKISGNHSFMIEYVRPGDEAVEFSGSMFITQADDGALTGNVSIMQDQTQFESCYRGGQLDNAASRVSGTTFTLAWDDTRGDRIVIRGSIVGNTLDGTFITEDTDAGGGNGCSSRSGQFSSTF